MLAISRRRYGVSFTELVRLDHELLNDGRVYRRRSITAESTSSPKPTAGSRVLRRSAPAKKSDAQITAITASTVLAGRMAFTSV